MKFKRLVPELSVSRFEVSLAFYTKVLGFHIEYQRPERRFVFLFYQGRQMMLKELNDVWKTADPAYPFGRGINIEITVDDLDSIIASLQAHRYPVFVEPEQHWYRSDTLLLGQREFLVVDPDGYLLRFAQPLGVKQA